MNLEKLDESEKFIVMWQYNYLGDFKHAFAECIKFTDDENLARIGRGFPLEVVGYQNYTRTPGWWTEVQKKAGIEPD